MSRIDAIRRKCIISWPTSVSIPCLKRKAISGRCSWNIRYSLHFYESSSSLSQFKVKWVLHHKNCSKFIKNTWISKWRRRFWVLMLTWRRICKSLLSWRSWCQFLFMWSCLIFWRLKIQWCCWKSRRMYLETRTIKERERTMSRYFWKCLCFIWSLQTYGRYQMEI